MARGGTQTPRVGRGSGGRVSRVSATCCWRSRVSCGWPGSGGWRCPLPTACATARAPTWPAGSSRSPTSGSRSSRWPRSGTRTNPRRPRSRGRHVPGAAVVDRLAADTYLGLAWGVAAVLAWFVVRRLSWRALLYHVGRDW